MAGHFSTVNSPCRPHDRRGAGITPESLSRFERGRASEFGSRKLLAVLAVLGVELEFTESGQSGSLDELRRERAKS
jgi:HTH-type transcriptional regulator / antitoxin HipB